MNRSLIIPLVSSALLIFGGTACSPKKEDKPPKPKVSAEANAKASDAPAPPAKTALALPKLGPAPAWELKDVDGKVVTSEQFKGKVVVVDFWATWCPPCRAEIPGYTELQKKYGKDGVVIVGVSIDEAGPDVVKPFMTKMGMNYPVVMGDEKVVAAFGGVAAIPTTFLIDRDGQIRDRKEGMVEEAEYEKRLLAVLN